MEMNKRLLMLVFGTITYASTNIRATNFLHKSAWVTPIKVDHDVSLYANKVALASGEPTDIVTIKNKEGGRLWTIHGEKPGNVILMIKRSKNKKALSYQYRVVEPKY